MSMSSNSHVFMTGATGLIGAATLERLLAADPTLTATVLVRSPERLTASIVAAHAERVTVLKGDLHEASLGLDRKRARELAARTTHVVHAAADTRFSQSLDAARRTNRVGTERLLELIAGRDLERMVFVSTAFTAGASTGVVLEQPHAEVSEWINAYEQSKHEAESVVLGSGLPVVVARSSTVVCDDQSGHVSQFNAVHRALYLFHSGLAAMLPGDEDSRVDVVTTEYVARGLETLTSGFVPEERSSPTIVHLCAGRKALRLGDMLDASRSVWQESSAWRGRGIERPSITSLANYRLFERSIAETADARIRAITKGLSTFVPQLALSKRFDTREADRLLGFTAPTVADYWVAMCRHLVRTRWGKRVRRAS